MSEPIPLPTAEPEPRLDRCETCRFWARDLHVEETVGGCGILHKGYPGSDDGWVEAGECRRNAPSASFDVDRIAMGKAVEESAWPDNCLATWPVTKPRDWCGEWQPKEMLPATSPSAAEMREFVSRLDTKQIRQRMTEIEIERKTLLGFLRHAMNNEKKKKASSES